MQSTLLGTPDVIKPAAEAVGGGGGGRPNLARAGGKDPDSIPSAFAAARTVVEAAKE